MSDDLNRPSPDLRCRGPFAAGVLAIVSLAGALQSCGRDADGGARTAHPVNPVAGSPGPGDEARSPRPGSPNAPPRFGDAAVQEKR